MKNLHDEFTDFTYEVDSIIDLSSDVGKTQPDLSLKDESVFDVYDQLKRDRLF
jgi:hypothetical protein